MALLKLEDFYPDYKDMSSGQGFDLGDIKDFTVYAQDENKAQTDQDKVGSVHTVLVDEQDGRFRYYVVDTGFWIFGKKVLLPVGLGRIDTNQKRIYVEGLTKEQVEDLPNFNDLDKLDFEHEEQVRKVYRPTATTARGTTANTTATTANTFTRDTYHYNQEPGLYDLNDRNNQSLKLYEERLVANKKQQKVGEVIVGKHVETETAHVSVPVEKERVVIERNVPTDRTAVDPSTVNFQEGEVARMEVYEETPDIRKEAVLREEVNVRKVVDRDVVTADEEIQREELDLDRQGRPVIDQ